MCPGKEGLPAVWGSLKGCWERLLGRFKHNGDVCDWSPLRPRAGM